MYLVIKRENKDNKVKRLDNDIKNITKTKEIKEYIEKEYFSII